MRVSSEYLLNNLNVHYSTISSTDLKRQYKDLIGNSTLWIGQNFTFSKPKENAIQTSFRINGTDTDEVMLLDAEFINPIKDKKGVVIADRLEQNIILIPFSFSDLPEEQENSVLLYIIEKLKIVNEETLTNFKKYFTMDFYKLVNDFTKVKTKREIKNLEDYIKNENVMVKHYTDKTNSSKETIVRATEKLAKLQQIQNITEEHLTNQLNEIRKLDFINDVRLETNNLRIYFKSAHYQKINLGEYVLIIKPNVYLKDIQIRAYNLLLKDKNLTSEVAHHPHINSDGEICYGNLRDIVDKLLLDMDLYGLVNAFWELINSYNRKNPYIKFARFARILKAVKEEKPLTSDVIAGIGETSLLCDTCSDYVSNLNYCFECDNCLKCCNCQDENLFTCGTCENRIESDNYCFDCDRCNDCCTCNEEEENESE